MVYKKTQSLLGPGVLAVKGYFISNIMYQPHTPGLSTANRVNASVVLPQLKMSPRCYKHGNLGVSVFKHSFWADFLPQRRQPDKSYFRFLLTFVMLNSLQTFALIFKQPSTLTSSELGKIFFFSA
jgi:hypothetical protein